MKKIILSAILVYSGLIANAQWTPLGSGSSNGTNNIVSALATYGGNLYAGGYFTTSGGYFRSNIAQWDGSSWSTPVGTGTNGTVLSLCVYAGELYVGGSFSNAGGIAANRIAKWNGTSWSDVGGGLSSGAVTAMTVYGGELYVGGNFVTAGSISVSNIAKWNGVSWSTVGSGLNAPCYSLTTYASDLAVGGLFTMAGGISASKVAKWDGTSWSAFSTGIPYTVYALEEYKTELYAGYGTGGLGITRWNGTSWGPVGGTALNTGAYALSFTKHNGYLYTGGAFISSVGGNPSYNIGIWDGANWYPGGTPATFTGLDDQVHALAVHNSEVYAGGAFTNDAYTGVSCNFVARWSGLVGIDEVGATSRYSVYPNPSSGQVSFDGVVENDVVEVMDITGRMILSEKSHSNKYTIDLGDKARGLYFYRITDDQGRIQQGKIILQ